MLGVIVSRAYFSVTAMAACVLLLLLCCRAREACQLRRYALPPERAPSVSRERDRVVPLACIPSGALCSDSASALPARNPIH
ncbi:hypothetical protein MRX96_034425 [Rhipicephalus microplus]